jgi:hypothetical protein
MPRIYASNNDPLDFCRDCFPMTEEEAFEEYGNIGDGPDNRGNCFAYEADHPDYEGWPEQYKCETCGGQLTKEDD